VSHLPERSLAATIDWHLYGPAWTGGATDLEGPAAVQHAACRYDVAYSATSYLGLPDSLDAVTPGASGTGTT
jgi:hypothetical protein